MNARSFQFWAGLVSGMALLIPLFLKVPTLKLQPVRIKANRNHHLARDSR